MNNTKRIRASGIERHYFNEKKYQEIIKMWEDELMDDIRRNSFLGFDKIN